ncbi:Polysaccharide pyruvyl transferase family protein WcaK [Haloechinothrix alba]|uniref:Polysaccharide pyruvyl transferase family protein WcaK n=1 Tax=Haloechinothrix alba TaxID=664784 RepID=A0A238V4B2_9PSEU|nr:polysaccharide pyruvyl transferase family protein [Haloechinothrix alba]SNR29076.1 Polysaccharide pyruvyl transferase family protein WcaK [Haloechinothrix alba]
MPSSPADVPVEHESRSPVYYLVAPVGTPNYGDELIAAGWLRYLAEHAPGATVWLDTHSPGPAQVLLAGMHPGLRVTDTLWRLCGAAPSEEPWQVSSWVQATVQSPGMAPHLHHGIGLLHSADVLHVLGGGYVNALWPRHIGLLAGVLAAACVSGARTAMTGHGLLPPAAGVAALLHALVARFDVVDARDRPSAELLGVERGVDDAFLALGADGYSDVDACWPGQEPPDVLLCVQSDMVRGTVTELAATVLATLREWRVPPHRVCFVEGIPRVDREVFELLEHELPGVRFYPFSDVWDRGLPARAGQVWISTRFHVHLVAAAAGASGVALPVSEEYYAVKHRSLAELGSGWDVAGGLGGPLPWPSGGGFDPAELARLTREKRDLAKGVYAPAAEPDGDG